MAPDMRKPFKRDKRLCLDAIGVHVKTQSHGIEASRREGNGHFLANPTWMASSRAMHRRMAAVGIVASLALATPGLHRVRAAAVPQDLGSDQAAAAGSAARSKGVQIVGHSDLGGEGLNAYVEVLGKHAFVGEGGPNGGFAAEWNRTPQCGDLSRTADVKVVSLADPAKPEVVSTITVGDYRTIARDVAVLRVKDEGPDNAAFTGDLLAVGVEHCNVSTTGAVPGVAEPARVGVDLYDVTDPAAPVLLGSDDRSKSTFQIGPRDVTLVQQPDGRVLLLEANHAGGDNNGVHVVDVTKPAAPAPLSTFTSGEDDPFSVQECRPFDYPQGVSTDRSGSRAYVAYGDRGLMVLDIRDPAAPKVLSRTEYRATEEGNSFRFIRNGGKLAFATDEDLLPARTTVTIAKGPASLVDEFSPGSKPGVFRGCEAIWGGPLFERKDPSVTSEIVFVGGTPDGAGGSGCEESDYDGIDAEGKIVLTFRGCGFNANVANAQAHGAVALLLANTTHPLFSPDSLKPGDAGITIPFAMISETAGEAISSAAVKGTVRATVADRPGTWGALRILDVSAKKPRQTAVFRTRRTRTLTPGQGLYYAMTGIWKGDQAVVAWMSDGLRVVDASHPTRPRGRAFFIPGAAPDPTGNYAKVPLVVDVERFGKRFVAIDINGGLYVLDVILRHKQCAGSGWKRYGFPRRSACVRLFRS